MKIRPVWAELLHADRRTDMTKERVAFHNFANGLKKNISRCSQYLINGKVPMLHESTVPYWPSVVPCVFIWALVGGREASGHLHASLPAKWPKVPGIREWTAESIWTSALTGIEPRFSGLTRSTELPPLLHDIYRVSQEERTKLRESVPYVKLYRYNPKHLYAKMNGYGDNGQRKVWTSCISAYCTSTAV